MATIYWAGDATAAFNGAATYPRTGIGQAMELYVPRSVRIENCAAKDSSTKSFIDEGRLGEIDHGLKPGDFLFIQFGHNDEKVKDTSRYTDADGDFKDNLKLFIDIARWHEATPVLITPLEYRHFENGSIVPSHGAYPKAVLETADEEKVLCVDLNRLSRELMEKMGEEASKSLFLHVPAGAFPAFPEGCADDEQLIYHGAVVFAGLIAEELLAAGGKYVQLISGGAFPAK